MSCFYSLSPFKSRFIALFLPLFHFVLAISTYQYFRYVQYGARCWSYKDKRWEPRTTRHRRDVCVVGRGQLLPGCKPGEPIQKPGPCKWMNRAKRYILAGISNLCWPFDNKLEALWGIRLPEENPDAQGWLAGCLYHSTSKRIFENRRADNQVQGSNEYKYSQAEDPGPSHSLLGVVSFSQGSV